MTSMNKFTVNLTPEFQNELDTIYFNLLFTNHSLKKSKSFFYEVRKSVLNLNIFPERYPRLSNYRKNKDENIRKLLLNNYVIIYRVEKELSQVFVLHIFHCNQNYIDKL